MHNYSISCLYDDIGERESNNGEVVQWVDDILHNCLFIVHAWGSSGIYDIPELVGDTILQIEGNISFVVLLLMLLLCLLALFCNLGHWMKAYLHTLQWFHSRLWFHMLCIFVCMFIHCEWWYAVCVCVCVCVFHCGWVL